MSENGSVDERNETCDSLPPPSDAPRSASPPSRIVASSDCEIPLDRVGGAAAAAADAIQAAQDERPSDAHLELESFQPCIASIGREPGIAPHELLARPTVQGATQVTCIDYSPTRHLVQEVDDLPAFLAVHRPEWSVVRWICVRGLKDMAAIHDIATKYNLHPLAIEDVLNPQRPKVEDFPSEGDQPSRLFIVVRAVRQLRTRLCVRQVSIFLGRHTLLTFQDANKNLFDSVRKRIETAASRLRQHDVSFLVHALLDTVVDDFFPVLDKLASQIEHLEAVVLDNPAPAALQKIHRVKKDLAVLRRAAWPLRELLLELRRDSHEHLSAETQTYLRDVYDHILVVFEVVESYRDVVASLAETYMSAISNRMNDIMKTLTIISTIFVPLTFLAGVYGMNMPIPENTHWWMYPLFWILSLSLAVVMLLWFRARKWI